MSENNKQAAYLNTALQVGLILALVSSVTSLTNLYLTVNSEPTGSIFDVKALVAGFSSCLFGIAAGIFVVKMYLKTQEDKVMKLGQGALLGLYTGMIAAIAGFLLGEIWLIVDPELYQNYMNASLDNFEAIPQFPQEALADMESNLAKLLTVSGRASNMVFGIPVSGIIVALSAMVGVKFFADTPEEL